MLDESGRGKKLKRCVEGKDGNTSAAIVSAEDMFSLGIQNEVAGSVAASRFLIDEGQ